MTVLKPVNFAAIRIPSTWANAQFYFEKVRDRPVWDFPLVNIASAMVVNGDNIERDSHRRQRRRRYPLRLAAVENAVRASLTTSQPARWRVNSRSWAPSHSAITATRSRSCGTW